MRATTSTRLPLSRPASIVCGTPSDKCALFPFQPFQRLLIWCRFFAGEIDCRQHDVWGSLFAISLGLVDDAVASAIVAQIVANASGIFQNGQVRQLIYPQLWERCIVSCPAPGTYQVRTNQNDVISLLYFVMSGMVATGPRHMPGCCLCLRRMARLTLL